MAWALKRDFPICFRTGDRPTALLTENSGASHGQKSRSTGQPKRDEATRAGAEKRSGGGAHSIGSSSLTGGHPSCRTTTTTCPKKQPVEGHSCWFTSGSGSSPHPDETGLPREAMAPAGRMAKQGEEEHNASTRSRTRSSRVPYCELSWREWDGQGQNNPRQHDLRCLDVGFSEIDHTKNDDALYAIEK